MSDSRIIKIILVLMVVVSFSLLMQDWDSSAPQVQGWNNFNNQLNTDPFENLLIAPSWPLTPCDYGYERRSDGLCYPIIQDDCGGDWLCELKQWADAVARAISYVFMWIAFIILWIATAIVTAISWIISGIIWLLTLIASFFGALIGMAQGMTNMPGPAGTLLLIIFIPFLALIIFTVLRMLRGN